jgi:hypothetical protein
MDTSCNNLALSWNDGDFCSGEWVYRDPPWTVVCDDTGFPSLLTHGDGVMWGMCYVPGDGVPNACNKPGILDQTISHAEYCCKQYGASGKPQGY